MLYSLDQTGSTGIYLSGEADSGAVIYTQTLSHTSFTIDVWYMKSEHKVPACLFSTADSTAINGMLSVIFQDDYIALDFIGSELRLYDLGQEINRWFVFFLLL